MGRQIQLHAFDGDYTELLSWAEARLGLILTLWSSESPVIEAIPQVPTNRETCALLDRMTASTLHRRRISRNDGSVSFLMPDEVALELSPSALAAWDGRTVLMQGRIYTGLEYGDVINKQYVSIASWIRRRWHKLPVTRMGFVGPQAWDWFQSGGTLMPMPTGLVPVESQAWRDYIAKLDSYRNGDFTPK